MFFFERWEVRGNEKLISVPVNLYSRLHLLYNTL